MEYKDIKQLLEYMGESKIDDLNIEFADGTKISMKKNKNRTNYINDNNGKSNDNKDTYNAYESADAKKCSTINNIKIDNTAIYDGERDLEKNCKIVRSPMIGTFYKASSPNKDPFVMVGSKVKKGDTLCIIEAMKLMNEIESEFDGEVVEILVENEEVVDYNKPLFKIV